MSNTGRKTLTLNPRVPKSPVEMGNKSVDSCASVEKSKALENLVSNLASQTNSRAFQSTLRYMLFRLIERNKGITLAKLKRYFVTTYMVDKKAVDAAIASLTASTLFDCVDKWQNPKCAHLGTEIGTHLFVKDTLPGPFESWVASICREHPELMSYEAELVSSSKSA